MRIIVLLRCRRVFTEHGFTEHGFTERVLAESMSDRKKNAIQSLHKSTPAEQKM